MSSAQTGHAAPGAADISGLFNATTRLGGVIGTAAAGTAYLALVHQPGQAVHGFALLCTALSVTAGAAAAMAALSIRRRPARPGALAIRVADLRGCVPAAAAREPTSCAPGQPWVQLPAGVSRIHWDDGFCLF
jgi:hypothetical protein